MPPAFYRYLIASMLTICAAGAAAQPVAKTSVPAAHPLLGQWRGVVMLTPAPGGSGAGVAERSVACSETLDYRANHIRLGTSGAEITRATFDVSAAASSDGFYRLAHTTLASNGRPDCAGDLHSETDDTQVRFIQFSPHKDQFIVCQRAALDACFGPFQRQKN